MSQTLLNKVAVITGAGSGIGRATAERFLAEGAKVVVFARTPAPLEEIAARAPARVLPVAGDVTRDDDLRRLAASAARRFGRVDVLLTAAGTVRVSPVVETVPAHIDEQFQVNFHGTLNTIREFLPHLNDSAAVICVTGQLADDCGLGGYNASKAAVAAWTRALAVELAPRGIRVNAIAPGPTATNLWQQTGLSARSLGQLLGKLKSRLKSGRLGTPQAVADVALFLASDASRHIMGQELVVDGGYAVG